MSVDNCLICLSSTKTKRVDIIPYLCHCKYSIHKKCYIQWKMTGTQRICLLCDVKDQEQEEEEIDTHYFGMVIVHPMAFHHHFCCMYFMTIVFLGYIILLCVFLIRISITQLKINT